MVGAPPADQDGGMPSSRLSSHAECSLAASAQELQRAASDVQKHASHADDLPMLGITLAHVEGTLDCLSVSMLQMANAVVEWCGDEGLAVDESSLPPQACALCFHLRAVADALRAPEQACTSSRIWAHRLLNTRSQGEHDTYVSAPAELAAAHLDHGDARQASEQTRTG
jgi:hypothetical protein